MVAEKNYTDEMDAIRKDVKALRNDLGKLVSALGTDLEAKGEDIKQAAREKINTVREKSKDSLHQIEETIEENPMTSLMAALGIGVLIGVFLNRR